MLSISKTICRKLDTYYAAGKLNKIEEYLLSELIKNQPLRGEFNAAYITALYELGIYFRRIKQYARSRDWFKLLGRIICTHLGAESFEHAVVLENIASTYELSGEFDRALHCYLQTLKVYKTVIGQCDARYIRLLVHVCRLFRAQGDYKAALLFRESAYGPKEGNGIVEVFRETRPTVPKNSSPKVLHFRQRQ